VPSFAPREEANQELINCANFLGNRFKDFDSAGVKVRHFPSTNKDYLLTYLLTFRPRTSAPLACLTEILDPPLIQHSRSPTVDRLVGDVEGMLYVIIGKSFFIRKCIFSGMDMAN